MIEETESKSREEGLEQIALSKEVGEEIYVRGDEIFKIKAA